MKGVAHASVALLLSLACFSPGRAAAEPSLWQRAASPRAARVERALVRMERVLDRVSEARDDQDMMQDFRLGTLAVAELTGARELGDPRLLVLLSQALVDAELGREGEAAALLERALPSADDQASVMRARPPLERREKRRLDILWGGRSSDRRGLC